jgi:SAM-dependent MidA family methyltransferase
VSANPLLDEIRALIAAEGPIGVDRYMALCLSHPRHGYYMTREPFGAAGDFVTAPEISQLFGEMIAVALAEAWIGLGRPAPCRLVEIGPGRGTLMADLLRLAAKVPGFVAATDVWLVETSPRLRAAQGERLSGTHPRLRWGTSLADVPGGAPLLLVANEFVDALPIRQFQRRDGRWRERLVGLNAGGAHAFGLAVSATEGLPDAGAEGDILEVCEAGLAFGRALGRRLAEDRGYAIVIDYGHLKSGFGDTLQAVANHASADPLADPGRADLTAHVDFEALAKACAAGGARELRLMTQRDFLQAQGIEERAAQLSRLHPESAAALAAGATRIAGAGPGDMGNLFKVLVASA